MRTRIGLSIVAVVVISLAACESGPESSEPEAANPARVRLEAALSDGTAIVGAAEADGESWEYLLQATSYDPATGIFTGDIAWPTLAAVHLVEGVVTEHTVTFTETDYLQEGSALLGCVYIADLVGDGSRLEGTWGQCEGWEGTFYMKVP